MTLDDAIEHARKVADEFDIDSCRSSDCADEHRQLADWLTELKLLRNENMKLRLLAQDVCVVLRNHYDTEWFDGTVLAERIRNLGIELPDGN